MYIKILASIFLMVSLSSFADVAITTENNSQDEHKIKNDLELLQKKYDLTPWIFTEVIKVDENAKTPRSHPVLTMSTQIEYLSSDIKLLSAFLHEQFHWHVVKNGKSNKNEFRKEIKAEFPDVQFERPLGSGTEGSTLSHIIVCYLEYVVLSGLVGNEKAIQTLSTNDYYIWVYQTVLNPENRIKLDKLVQKFGLEFRVNNS